jgi:hypothetical protein
MTTLLEEARVMSKEAELLFANESFYEIFRSRDLEAMEGFWSRERPVACIHPGWEVLADRDRVMRSWAGIFSNPRSPKVTCRQAWVLGSSDGDGQSVPDREGISLVICYEIVGDQVLIATNAYAREGGNWKIVHHQSGPCNMELTDLGSAPSAGAEQTLQ